MKEKKLYTCELCNTDYKEKNKALECENNHKKVIRISDVKYNSSKSNSEGYPVAIDVEFENGVVRYKR